MTDSKIIYYYIPGPVEELAVIFLGLLAGFHCLKLDFGFYTSAVTAKGT
jgi:hypothetical protein